MSWAPVVGACVAGLELTNGTSTEAGKLGALVMFGVIFVGARVGRIVGVRLTFIAIAVGLDLLTLSMNLFVGETEGG